jgi:hypothetical protein
MFKMVVQDNGVGRKRSHKTESHINGDHKSLGLKITTDRIRLLNETHHTEAFKMIITDLDEHDSAFGGVRVEFWFPLIEM